MNCYLESSYQNGKTVAADMYYHYPLKFLEVDAMNGKISDALWIFVAGYGGGMVSGDAIDIQITARSSSKLVITGQSSMKVYKAIGNQASRSHLNATAESDAMLFVVYPPLTCFAGASYSQKQTFHLEPSANLFLVDWITSGRLANEESWKFSTLKSSTEIYSVDNLVVKEDMRLADVNGLSIATRMHSYTTIATVFIVGPSLLKYATKVIEEINAKQISRTKIVPEMLYSASEIKVMEGSKLKTIGAVVKVSSNSTQTIQKFLSTTFSGLWQDFLGEDPYKN